MTGSERGTRTAAGASSDLAVVPFIVVSILAVLTTLAAFFLIGVVVGFIVLIVWIVLAIVASARFLRRNELN
jgi:hypothetical protein